MKTKKRKKSTRFRGTHTHGRGFKKKARGSGHRGGVGMAGTGKRGDQKKTLILNLPNKYFGKRKTLKAGPRTRIEAISLESIARNIGSYVKEGKAKETKGAYDLDLKENKIIGNNVEGLKVKIHAKAASKGAVEAVQKAGGEIVLAKKEN
jgi:large subunit ribosomal protein L15